MGPMGVHLGHGHTSGKSSTAHEEESTVVFALEILGQNLAVSAISIVHQLIFPSFSECIRLFSLLNALALVARLTRYLLSWPYSPYSHFLPICLAKRCSLPFFAIPLSELHFCN